MATLIKADGDPVTEIQGPFTPEQVCTLLNCKQLKEFSVPNGVLFINWDNYNKELNLRATQQINCRYFIQGDAFVCNTEELVTTAEVIHNDEVVVEHRN